MTKNTVERHALAQRHFRQIVCRPVALRKKLMPVWAITWRPGDRSGSFLGQLFRPLGSAVMMCQVSYPREEGREGIGLLGIGAQIDPQTATVTYDEGRLRHDFSRVPFVGARGAILDPSDDQVGGRGNGSWVQLALEVDRVRQRMATGSFHLPSVPQLPEIYFGYSRKEVARYEVTPQLCRYAARGLEVCWTGNALSDFDRLDAETAAAQDQAFAALSAEQQEQLLREAWEAAFIPPSDPDNGTGLWLLPHALTTDVYRTVRMPEPEQIRLVRANLKPHVSQSCTDEDILGAVRDPNGPLYAAGLCRVQGLYRNPRVPLAEALSFSPQALGRDRVQATLWHDDWPRRKVDREVVQQLLAAAA